MSVRYADGIVHLSGDCRVEDAETLLTALQGDAAAAVDLSDCTRLHMAVVQVLLAAGRGIDGDPASPFIRTWVLPQLSGASARKQRYL
jgi:hypothetical protein